MASDVRSKANLSSTPLPISHIYIALLHLCLWLVYTTKNRLMVTIHSKDVPEILALYRRSEIDFPPHFLVRLMHSFPMMYNTI